MEHLLAKEGVAGSIPVSRSSYFAEAFDFRELPLFCMSFSLKTVEDNYKVFVIRSKVSFSSLLKVNFFLVPKTCVFN